MQEAKAEFEKILAISDVDFEKYTIQKRKEIIDYHLKNNASYQKFIGGNSFQNWNELPVMTKKEFQKPLSDRLSKGFTLKNVYVNKTSGSSGDPFVFAKDKFCHAVTWANNISRFGWFGIDFKATRMASLCAMSNSFDLLFPAGDTSNCLPSQFFN